MLHRERDDLRGPRSVGRRCGRDERVAEVDRRVRRLVLRIERLLLSEALCCEASAGLRCQLGLPSLLLRPQLRNLVLDEDRSCARSASRPSIDCLWAARSATTSACSTRASFRLARRVCTSCRNCFTSARIRVSWLETRWIASNRATMSSRLFDPSSTSRVESPWPFTYRSRRRSEMRRCATFRLLRAATRWRAFDSRSPSIRSSSTFA